ncbi:MAG: hypothetical protein ABI729_08090 [Chitinophagales bacterium]
MKKLLFIATITIVGLASCKKDYNCTCDILGTVTVTPIQNVSKDDAQSTCDAANVSAVLFGGTCTLD